MSTTEEYFDKHEYQTLCQVLKANNIPFKKYRGCVEGKKMQLLLAPYVLLYFYKFKKQKEYSLAISPNENNCKYTGYIKDLDSILELAKEFQKKKLIAYETVNSNDRKTVTILKETAEFLNSVGIEVKELHDYSLTLESNHIIKIDKQRGMTNFTLYTSNGHYPETVNIDLIEIVKTYRSCLYKLLN